jgi:hypothetical protein
MKAAAAERASWAWLFPITYVAHIAEEWWGVFPAWASRLFGATLSDEAFWAINGAGLLLFCAAAAVAQRGGAPATALGAALGAIVAGNGSTHVVASLLTGTYSPGTVTGAVLWIPLGAASLRWARPRMSALGWAAGIAAGLLVLLGVFALASSGPRG